MMMTRLVLLLPLPERGLPRRLLGGRRAAATAAIVRVRVWRPTVEDDEDDGGNGEVACWGCSSSCGCILALSLSARGEEEKRRRLVRRSLPRKEKRKKK